MSQQYPTSVVPDVVVVGVVGSVGWVVASLVVGFDVDVVGLEVVGLEVVGGALLPQPTQMATTGSSPLWGLK